jgi:hypothetical protein
MTPIFHLFNNMFLIIYILFSILLLFIFIYQIELKRSVLFSSLLTLSVNTIPEDETEYLFESSSDELESESSISLTENSASDTENIILSDKSKINLRLLLISNKEAPTQNLNSSILVEEIGLQTQLSEFEKVIYSNIEKDIRAKADLIEFGTESNIHVDSRELVSKGVQTKPDLQIDLSSTSMDIQKDITTNSILDVLPQDIDPLLIEAYIPAPEISDIYLGLALSNGCFFFNLPTLSKFLHNLLI